MAAIAFDTLSYARRLKDAGVPDKQAEAQAELMAEAFVFNMDSLVTKDYLDARLAAQDAKVQLEIRRIESKLDLHSWILAIIALSTVVPTLSRLLGY